MSIKLIITILTLIASYNAYAEYWTFKIDKGVLVTESSIKINIGSVEPFGPNPASSTWNPCRDNWVYIDRKNNGELYNSEITNRMLSVAIAASKSKTSVRLNISRDSNNECFTSQVWDINQ